MTLVERLREPIVKDTMDSSTGESIRYSDHTDCRALRDEAADRIEDWQDAGERYQKAIEQLEAALSGMLAYFVDGKDPSEDQLRDPDFWEGSYKSAPSQEYLDYWKVVDGARAALDPTYTASANRDVKENETSG